MKVKDLMAIEVKSCATYNTLNTAAQAYVGPTTSAASRSWTTTVVSLECSRTAMSAWRPIFRACRLRARW